MVTMDNMSFLPCDLQGAESLSAAVVSYECDYCEGTFFTVMSFKAHRKKVHGLDTSSGATFGNGQTSSPEEDEGFQDERSHAVNGTAFPGSDSLEEQSLHSEESSSQRSRFAGAFNEFKVPAQLGESEAHDSKTLLKRKRRKRIKLCMRKSHNGQMRQPDVGSPPRMLARRSKVHPWRSALNTSSEEIVGSGSLVEVGSTTSESTVYDSSSVTTDCGIAQPIFGDACISRSHEGDDACGHGTASPEKPNWRQSSTPTPTRRSHPRNRKPLRASKLLHSSHRPPWETQNPSVDQEAATESLGRPLDHRGTPDAASLSPSKPKSAEPAALCANQEGAVQLSKKVRKRKRNGSPRLTLRRRRKNFRMATSSPAFDSTVSISDATELSELSMEGELCAHRLPADVESTEVDGVTQKALKCQYCGKCYKMWWHLAVHESKHVHAAQKAAAGRRTSTEAIAQSTPDVFAFPDDEQKDELGNPDISESQRCGYFCKYCGKFYKYSGRLSLHEMKHHLQQEGGSKSLPAKPKPSTHSTGHPKNAREGTKLPGPQCYTCRYCGKSFRMHGRLVSHEAKHKKSSVAPVKKNDAKSPEGVVQKAPGPYPCRHCGKPFKLHRRLVVHERRHEVGLPRGRPGSAPQSTDSVSSDLGNASFKTTDQSSPTPPRNYKCKQCNKTYRLFWRLAVHEITHIDTAIQDSSPTQPDPPALCPDERPEELPELEDSKLEVSSPREYKCSYCGKRFRVPWRLTVHESMHETSGGLTASEADKEFDLPQATNKSPSCGYECKYCGKSYKVPWLLALHESRHVGGKNILSSELDKVPVCPPPADPSGTEAREECAVSLPAKIFKCRYCGKAYRMARRLATHEAKKHEMGEATSKPARAHRDTQTSAISEMRKPEIDVQIKAFHCTHCPKSFQTKRQVTRHEKAHMRKLEYATKEAPAADHSSKMNNIPADKSNPDGDVKKYPCLLCGRAYKVPWQLRLHMNRHKLANSASSTCVGSRGKPTASSVESLDGSHRAVSSGPTEHVVGANRRQRPRGKKRALRSLVNRPVQKNQQQQQHQGDETATPHKAYQCQYCDKAYRVYWHYVLHESRHTGGITVQCDRCDFTSVMAKELEDHYRQTHGMTQERAKQVLASSVKHQKMDQGSESPSRSTAGRSSPIHSTLAPPGKNVRLKKSACVCLKRLDVSDHSETGAPGDQAGGLLDEGVMDQGWNSVETEQPVVDNVPTVTNPVAVSRRKRQRWRVGWRGPRTTRRGRRSWPSSRGSARRPKGERSVTSRSQSEAPEDLAALERERSSVAAGERLGQASPNITPGIQRPVDQKDDASAIDTVQEDCDPLNVNKGFPLPDESCHHPSAMDLDSSGHPLVQSSKEILNDEFREESPNEVPERSLLAPDLTGASDEGGPPVIVVDQFDGERDGDHQTTEAPLNELRPEPETASPSATMVVVGPSGSCGADGNTADHLGSGRADSARAPLSPGSELADEVEALSSDSVIDCTAGGEATTFAQDGPGNWHVPVPWSSFRSRELQRASTANSEAESATTTAVTTTNGTDNDDGFTLVLDSSDADENGSVTSGRSFLDVFSSGKDAVHEMSDGSSPHVISSDGGKAGYETPGHSSADEVIIEPELAADDGGSLACRPVNGNCGDRAANPVELSSRSGQATTHVEPLDQSRNFLDAFPVSQTGNETGQSRLPAGSNTDPVRPLILEGTKVRKRTDSSTSDDLMIVDSPCEVDRLGSCSRGAQQNGMRGTIFREKSTDDRMNRAMTSNPNAPYWKREAQNCVYNNHYGQTNGAEDGNGSSVAAGPPSPKKSRSVWDDLILPAGDRLTEQSK